MLKWLFYISMVLYSLPSFAQVVKEADVPAEVKTKMKQMFPGASVIVWSKESPGFINSDFVLDKSRMTAVFSTSGSWVATETQVKREQFPLSIGDYLNTNFPEARVSHCIKASSVKQETYECRVKTKTGDYELVFDTAGNMLMKSAVEK